MATPTDPLMSLLGDPQQQQPQQTPMLPQQGAPQGVLPPTNPVQAPQQPPQMSGADLTPMMQQIAEQYQKPAMQGEMNVAQQMGPMTQPTAIPKMGYQPNFQPMDSAGHVLGDIGKALLLGLSATGPGRAVEGAVYGPRVRQYEAGQQQKAQQIEALKNQAGAYGQTGESASRAIGGLGEASYRQGMLGLGAQRNQINQQKADQQGQKIANEYAVQGQRLAQGWDRLDQGQQNIAIKQWFDKGVLQSMNARIDAGMDENSARLQAQEDMKAAATQSGFATKYPILGQLMGAVGLSPDLTSAPAAGVPKPVGQAPRRAGGPAKPAAKSGPPKGATHTGMGPDGKKHYADAQGNDLGLVQ
jgi:hypothetical protein